MQTSISIVAVGPIIIAQQPRLCVVALRRRRRTWATAAVPLCGLGHRNFNAYVNGLRLEQACKALADPALRHLPVLSIALDAGFQSIGPFNRAFKAAMGVTPTDYRRHKLAES